MKGTINVQAENIFPIIKKFLYSDHEIFLRELVSNAVDATTKIKTLSRLGEYKGEVGNTVQDLLGGIRSTCTYVGANNLKQLSKCTTFIIAQSQYNSVYEHMDTSK